MLFQTFEFLVFLPTVFFLYWLILRHHLKAQNVLILVSSYIFYGWWDWRFLILIFISSLTDFLLGKEIYAGLKSGDKRRAKILLGISLVVNLGMLGFFKYFNFFIDSFRELVALAGFETNTYSLIIILPVGISFYTFQTLSYSIDIYRGKIRPSTNAITFFAFVSFFPQLVAGPIERASNLLPQFNTAKEFNYSQAKDGLLQIVAGLFKKLVIADTCALYADLIFQGEENLSGSVLLLGAIYFAFQIYGDFSGYSDIAIGTAKLFGIRLMTNFQYPYFSRDIAEFWRRWHISLSTWFRDYLYIPLGGSRVSRSKVIRNTFIIFIVSGFWHGASWTFIAWGLLNAIYFLPLQLLDKNRQNLEIVANDTFLPSIRDVLRISLTFFLTCIGWVFFRASNMSHAFSYISNMIDKSLFQFPDQYRTHLPLVILFVCIEWIFRKKEHILQFNEKSTSAIRWTYYYGIFLAVLFHLGKEEVKFIYFDF